MECNTFIMTEYLAILAIFSVTPNAEVRQFRAYLSEYQEEKILWHNIVDEQEAENDLNCIYLCTLHDDCFSVYYRTEDGLCIMVSRIDHFRKYEENMTDTFHFSVLRGKQIE